MNNQITLQENLDTINRFVKSKEFKSLHQLSREDQLIKKFVNDIELYHHTIKFFIINVGDLNRATLESNYLVNKILLYNTFDGIR